MTEPSAAGSRKGTRRVSRLVLVSLFIGMIGGAAIAIASIENGVAGRALAWLPQLGASTAEPPGAAQLAGLEARVSELGERLDATEKASANPPVQQTGDLAAELQQLSSRVDALESSRAELDRVQSRLTALERNSSDAERERAARILALALLMRDASAARPLKPALDAYAALAPGDPAVAALIPYAERTVPAQSALADRFPDAARAALAAERVASANGILAQWLAHARNLVSIRRVDPASGDTTEDRFARAQADLDRGDLASAVTETRALTGGAAQAMAPWLKDAEARIAVDSAIADIDARLVRAVGGQPATQGTAEGAKP